MEGRGELSGSYHGPMSGAAFVNVIFSIIIFIIIIKMMIIFIMITFVTAFPPILRFFPSV